MLPKRKTGTTAPRPKPKLSSQKGHTNDIVEELQRQIEEEKRKKLEKAKIDKEKTPLLQKTITKKRTAPKATKNTLNSKPENQEGMPMDVVAPLPVDELPKTNEKKYADSTTTTETTETETISIYAKPKTLEPTAFTYFDRLANKDILLSDSD